MVAILGQDGLVDRVDLIRLDIGRRLDPVRPGFDGPIFDACSDCPLHGRPVRSEDRDGPLARSWGRDRQSVGGLDCPHSRSLDRAFVDSFHRLRGRPSFGGTSSATVEGCNEGSQGGRVAFRAEVIEADFIGAAVELLADCPLWGTAHSAFDCAILNPPYRKLNSEIRNAPGESHPDR